MYDFPFGSTGRFHGSLTSVAHMITSWMRPPVVRVAPVPPQEWLRIKRACWIATKGRISTKSWVGGPAIGSKRGRLGKGGRGVRKPGSRVRTTSPVEEVCIWISLCVISISIS